MTDDIVHRLRNPSHWLFQIVGPKSGATVQGESDAPREAADEIERLRADLDAYQKERDEEVVRLRVELAAEKDRGNNWREACQVQNERVEKVITERDELRAERDALRADLAAEKEAKQAAVDAAETYREERDAMFAALCTLRARRQIVYAPDAQAMSDRVRASEAERDALRALLREARNIMPRDWAFWSRIDAALKGDGDE